MKLFDKIDSFYKIAKMSIHEAYNILGLQPGARPDEVKMAHRKLLLKHHPDINPGQDTTALMAQINAAKDVIDNYSVNAPQTSSSPYSSQNVRKQPDYWGSSNWEEDEEFARKVRDIWNESAKNKDEPFDREKYLKNFNETLKKEQDAKDRKPSLIKDFESGFLSLKDVTDPYDKKNLQNYINKKFEPVSKELIKYLNGAYDTINFNGKEIPSYTIDNIKNNILRKYIIQNNIKQRTDKEAAFDWESGEDGKKDIRKFKKFYMENIPENKQENIDAAPDTIRDF